MVFNSCNNEIIVPSLKIQQKLRQGENIIEYIPAGTEIGFSCWMGMIRGVIKVVDDLNTVDVAKVEPLPPADSSCSSGSCDMGGQPQPSIYGDDISKAPTERLIKKVAKSENLQTAQAKGVGYELEPLVIIVAKGQPAQITFDLTEFDIPEGKFEIVDSTTRNTLVSFPGKKGEVVVQIKPQRSGSNVIVKDGSLLGVIEVVDDLAAANVEDVRKKLL